MPGIPSMEEISAVPWNGLRAVSTFSGCGGGCLGLRWAGYRVLWASEFVPAAQEVYRLNHPRSFLNTQDIRDVSVEQILEEAGLENGELDILEGSPPCSAFSMVGSREAGWGKVKAYSDVRQKTDDLFFEFARILRGLQPRAFAAENVPGLAAGKARGYFKEVMRELRSCGYAVRARILDAQWLGVPQTRRRLIFVGTRNDLGLDPHHPLPSEGRPPTVRDVVRGARRIKLVASGFKPRWVDADPPCPTILQNCTFTSRRGSSADVEDSAGHRRKWTIDELKRICGFPDDFRLEGTYAQQWERLGRAVPPPMAYAVGLAIKNDLLEVCSAG